MSVGLDWVVENKPCGVLGLAWLRLVSLGLLHQGGYHQRG
jgi:hypothetical protein